MKKLQISIFSIIIPFFVFNGCAKYGKHMPIEIKEPAQKNQSEITNYEVGFNEDILPILDSKCKMCHFVGSTMDWSQYKIFSAIKDKIIARVFEKQDMPMAGFPKLTPEEMDTMKLWIEIGMPEKKFVEE